MKINIKQLMKELKGFQPLEKTSQICKQTEAKAKIVYLTISIPNLKQS